MAELVPVTLSYGPGNAGFDLNLYRSAAAQQSVLGVAGDFALEDVAPAHRSVHFGLSRVAAKIRQWSDRIRRIGTGKDRAAEGSF